MTVSRSNIEAVRMWWDAWEAGRPHAATECVRHDVVLRTDVGDSRPVIGLREIRAMIDDMAEEGLQVSSRAERWEDLGDYVLVSGARVVGSGDLVEETETHWVFYVPDGIIASVTSKPSVDEAFEHVLWDRR